MEPVALIGPAWLWIGAVLLLMLVGGIVGALACCALKVAAAQNRIDDYEDIAAKKSDVLREVARLDARITVLTTRPQVPALWPRDDEATDTIESPALRM